MKVIAAVNGLVTAEVAALYALHYARVFGFTLSLLHVINPDDNRDEVEKSMTAIEEAAMPFGTATERIFLDGDPVRAIKGFLAETRADVLFCSTRMRRRFFENSLSERLTRLSLPVDLAVVRVVHPNAAHLAQNSVLPIREDRLSEKKFTLFAALTKAYAASAEIYSVSVTGKRKLAELDLPATRELLRRINGRLVHYVRLARLMDVPLRLKHAFATNEVDQILHHLSHHEFQLAIIGGQRLSAMSRLFGERPIERLFRYTPVNTIAFYARDKG
ncbi:MAG: hypothetical protein A2521_17235 [Deltaproteobacteria bacterium RIFOXYD12_FULL_57_12]|nr:MAG: hypothetical protein A2521_17235 [Deltaproteobacteria bacterium RIFOXYD12_FULL_57_12]